MTHQPKYPSKMKAFSLIVCGCLAFSLGFPKDALATTKAPATLKSQVNISGETVTLGDLFLNAGDAGEIVVAAAPDPGRKARLSPRHVQRVAAQNGMLWRNPARLDWITVKRSSQIVSKNDVLRVLDVNLEEAGFSGIYEIVLSDRQLTLHVATDVEASVEILAIDVDKQKGFFEAQLRAPAGDQSARIVPITGRVFPALEIPVINAAKQKGDIITGDDIEWITSRLDRLGRDAITDADELVGKAAKRRLASGQPLRANDVEAPVVVKKGSYVAITYATNALRLTAEGRALKSGGVGETIQVINTRSNQTVYAKIEGPANVTVTPRQLQVSAFSN